MTRPSLYHTLLLYMVQVTVFCTTCVFYAVHIWYVPYTYTHTMAVCVWYHHRTLGVTQVID